MTTIIEVQQGSPEWHQFRATSFGASEASAMLGISSYKTRSQLLKEKATGLVPEVDAATQRRFDLGHEYEAAARPLAEEIIGDELYPVTLAIEIDGITLSASMDGLTMMEDAGWEHKLLNAKLASSLSSGVIPDEYHPQLEQQLLVSGAKGILFMASSGNKEDMPFAWYTSNPDLRQRIIEGWKQFAIDVANYQHKEAKAEVIANPQADLPVLSVEVSGSIAVIDNLDRFGEALTLYVDGLNMKPKDDQDFADLDAACKTLKKAEDELTAGEDRALSQAEEIETLRRKVDKFRELARTTRLRAEKVVKAEKDNRREEIRRAGVDAYRNHIDALNARLSRVRLPDIPADFAGVMKGKRTIASLEDAVSTELARVKIESNAMADKIDANLDLIDCHSTYQFLFADLQQLVTKDYSDLQELIVARVNNHLIEERRRLDAERERIRQEEESRAEASNHIADTRKMVDRPTEKPRIRQQESTTRPTRAQIIATVALAFKVSEEAAEGWIVEEFCNGFVIG